MPSEREVTGDRPQHHAIRRWHGVGLVLLLGLLLVPACSSMEDFTVLGYTTRPRYARDIRTIRVPIFKNKTLIRDVEFELTEAIIREVEAKTPWKVVDGDADVELSGTIVTFLKREVLQNTLNGVRAAELVMNVQVSWKDLRTGQDLTRQDMAPPPEILLPHGAPPPPLAPPPSGPLGFVMLQQSATFVPELGQSYATARQQVMRKMAGTIVSAMELPW